MPSLAAFYNNNKKEEMMFLMKKLVGMLSFAICIIAILSLVFADPIITIIGGAKYAHTEAVNLFRIFMTIAIMYPADRFFALTLDVINKPEINFYKIIIMVLMNLFADYAGILVFKNVYGIAVANVFPVAAAIIISYVYLNKYAKFNFWSIFKIGFVESIALVKQVYQNAFAKPTT
jgi:O-antigen/teichoic acid export membrane protein